MEQKSGVQEIKALAAMEDGSVTWGDPRIGGDSTLQALNL